tara:strand:- start:199 stop:675 length:477 start_codon:yes stop_codon:yes gene_type:complete
MKPVKPKIQYYTEVIDGYLHMECKVCGVLKSVGDEAVATTCSLCVTEQFEKEFPFEANTGYKPSGKPRGWAFMKEYVDKDGNVYHRGTEQPGLKGTLKATVIKVKAPKVKMTKTQRQQIKTDAFAKIHKLKKKLSKVKFKKDTKQISSEIKKLQKLVK